MKIKGKKGSLRIDEGSRSIMIKHMKIDVRR